MESKRVLNGMADEELGFGQLEAASGALDLFSVAVRSKAESNIALIAENSIAYTIAGGGEERKIRIDGCDLVHLSSCFYEK